MAWAEQLWRWLPVRVRVGRVDGPVPMMVQIASAALIPDTCFCCPLSAKPVGLHLVEAEFTTDFPAVVGIQYSLDG